MADPKIADPSREFTILLAELNGGAIRDELGETLAGSVFTLHEQATATCSKRKGKITLALSLTVEPSGAVRIDAEVVTKMPTPPRASDHFFVQRGGALTRKNPRQQELPLREVTPLAAPAREAGNAAQPAREA